MEHLFLMFLDHTQRCSTDSRTPLDKWSAHPRDLYLTTHDTTDKYPSPRWDSNPRSQQVSGLRAPGAWTFVCCECRVLSGRGLYNQLITRPEESYRLCCVVVCDLETSRIGAPYIYDISSLRVKLLASQAHLINRYKSTRSKLQKIKQSPDDGSSEPKHVAHI